MKFNFFNFVLLFVVSFALCLMLLMYGASDILIAFVGFTIGFFWDMLTGRPVVSFHPKDEKDKK